MALGAHDLKRIEHAARFAWPARETAHVHGWLWRYSGGGSQRANSVSPLDFDGGELSAAIAEAERRYAARQAAPMFQISDIVEPAELDAELEARGYRLQEPCTCLAKALDSGTEMPGEIEVAERAGEDWLSVYLPGITPSRRATAPEILTRVPRPSAFLLRRQNGVPISVALAVVHGGVVIAECVATLADYRRRGASEVIMRALEAWGVAERANLAALQAVAENAPAQALYAKLGYRRVGGYHYRVLDR